MEKDDMIKLQNLSADMARKDDAASNQVCSAHKHRLGELSKLIETYSNPETKRQAELAEAQANAKIVEAKRIADEREAAVKKIRENEAKRQAELERSMKLIEAQRKAVISCNGKTVCDKAFALTQIFISEYADMRIQMANETIIETFGSSPGFKLSAKATKVPQAGSTSLIRLSLNCNPDSAIAIGMCDAKLHHVYSEFPKYVKNRLKN